MNKYQKVVMLDNKINDLKKVRDNVVKGDEHVSGAIIGTDDFYTTVGMYIKREWGKYTYSSGSIEYAILGNVLLDAIDDEIKSLKEKRISIINPWWKRIFKSKQN